LFSFNGGNILSFLITLFELSKKSLDLYSLHHCCIEQQDLAACKCGFKYRCVLL